MMNSKDKYIEMNFYLDSTFRQRCSICGEINIIKIETNDSTNIQEIALAITEPQVIDKITEFTKLHEPCLMDRRN